MDNSNANAPGNKLKRQSNSEDQNSQPRVKANSTTRMINSGGSQGVNNQSKNLKRRGTGDGNSPIQNDGNNQSHRRQGIQALALEMAADSNEGLTSENGNENPDGFYYNMGLGGYPPGSAQNGNQQTKSTMSDTVDRRNPNAGVSASIGVGGGSANSQGAHHQSDMNMGHHNTYQNAQRGRGTGNSFGNRQTGHSANFDGQRKKRKTSEKAAKRSSQHNQRKMENGFDERKGRDPNGVMIPPIDALPGNNSGMSGMNNSNGQNRSNSRGNPQFPNGGVGYMQQQHNNMQHYFSSNTSTEDDFHNFTQGANMQNQQQSQPPSFGMTMAGMGLNGLNMGGGQHTSFPFTNNGQPPAFIGGSNQAPQVHFIAKKQQFIAQISPDQLMMNGDKRPYTAQSFNNLSSSAKRAGGIYGGHGKGHNAQYNLANAAFVNNPAVYLGQMGQGSKTHTNGFSFNPQSHIHKYSNSFYSDEVKPKIAGKDILQQMAESNGFSSGYHSDPYTSVISQGGLPATFNLSNRPHKGTKGSNRLHTKEKEQLYDETIKMKVINNQLRDDTVKFKTKIKILENELNRKEKTIEDLFSHNQMIQQSHSKTQSNNSNQSLMPLGHSHQTTQKYQQETFLVMSLKKQIRELKFEVVKRDEELEILRKNIRNTKSKEMEQEIMTYREECIRMRTMIQELLTQGSQHPIHQQDFQNRVLELQSQLQSKDEVIQQLTQSMNNSMLKEQYNSASTQVQTGPQLPNGTNSTGEYSGNAHTTSLAAVRSQNSHHLESSPSAGDMGRSASMVAPQRQNGQIINPQPAVSAGTRDKSAEKKNVNNTTYTSQPQKEIQRDLQKTKKSLREKEKEINKLRGEITSIRRESHEKYKQETLQNKDQENQVKILKDKQRELKMDMKRKDERNNEQDMKYKKIDENFRVISEALKNQEDANKHLKQQLKQAKQQLGQKNQTKMMESKKAALYNKSEQSQLGDSKFVKDTSNTSSSLREEKDIEKKKKDREETLSSQMVKTTENSDLDIGSHKQDDKNIPIEELKIITLIGQREKLSRDDLTSMIITGEENLRMLIRQPSEKLVEFIKSNIDNEDKILIHIPRFEIPKPDFESQVLREMRLVLKENIDKISDKTQEELMEWSDFEKFYAELDNFEYPHKDKLLDFIKYFFLDHIESKDLLQINYQAFKEHVTARRPMLSAERTRNPSMLKSRRKSGDSFTGSGSLDDSMKKRMLGMGGPDSEETKYEEEKMLDIAEQSFMRIADMLQTVHKTVKQAFLKFAEPEPFKDGTVLELMNPRSFIQGLREIGFEDITDLEITCLMKVLAKPELDEAVILNEFILIMENFGVPVIAEEEEYENDYIPDSDNEEDEEMSKTEKDYKDDQKASIKDEEGKFLATSPANDTADPKVNKDDEYNKSNKDEKKDDQDEIPEITAFKKRMKESFTNKSKYPIIIDFDVLDKKAVKILKKMARFLLERYMHPREFFGPTIKKESIGKKLIKIEVIKYHDFYLRLKLASIRKKLKENETINKFFAIDGNKYPGFMQVKRMIKALEIIAEGEQEDLIKENEEKEKQIKAEKEKVNKERAEKGLPPLEQEEEEEFLKKEKDKEEEAEKKKKPELLEIDKPPLGPRGELDQMLKLTGSMKSIGGGSSPQNKDGSRFQSGPYRGATAELNTIEEDLHETQTSHYSQAIHGDGTDREGSRHQLSTSNNLRNSNNINELGDSARLSGAQSIKDVPYPGISVNSDGGIEIQTSPKKFKSKVKNLRSSLPDEKSDYPLDAERDEDQKMKDELDAEVDKQYQKQMANSQDDAQADNNYNDDFNEDEDKDDMREDTIQTDQIERIVQEEEMRRLSKDKKNLLKNSNGKSLTGPSQPEDAIYNDMINNSLDELDVQADLQENELDANKAKRALSKPNSQLQIQEEESQQEDPTPRQNAAQSQRSLNHSEYDEDYEI